MVNVDKPSKLVPVHLAEVKPANDTSRTSGSLAPPDGLAVTFVNVTREPAYPSLNQRRLIWDLAWQCGQSHRSETVVQPVKMLVHRIDLFTIKLTSLVAETIFAVSTFHRRSD